MAEAETERLIAARAGRPYPARITLALDAPAAPGAVGPLEGPGVDEFCGVTEPTVDRWESGELVPTRAQLEALAVLTGYPLGFFFTEPVGSLSGGWFCVHSGPDRGCRPLVEDPPAGPAQTSLF